MALIYVVTLVTLASLLSNHVTMETLLPITLNYHIFEEISPGSSIAHLKEDTDLVDRYSPDELALVEFRFLMPPTLSVTLDTNTGDLVTNGRLDREEFCEFLDTCEVYIDIVVQPVQYFQMIKIILVVEDLNDNEPAFEEPIVSIQILESIATGTSLALPEAYDRDSPQNGIRSYELLGTLNHFRLHSEKKIDGSTALKLIVDRSLDRETHAQYDIELVAMDHGNRAGSCEIQVQIQDANDNNPMFRDSTYQVRVTENVDIGSTILRVEADDPDEGANGEIVYTFSTRTREKYGDILLIDPLSGDIIVIDVLDYEQHQILHLAVIAEDGGSNTLPAEAIVIVTLTDVNDNPPDVTVNTLTGSDMAEIAENSPLGTFVAHLSVVDGDSGQNGLFDCFLSHPAFSLSKFYDSEYQVVTTALLDRETKVKYDVTIECIDGGLTRLATVTILSIVVRDYNDNAPQFQEDIYHISIRENNPIGRSLLQVRALDSDIGANAFVSYSIAHEARRLFKIDSETGKICAAISYDREENEVLNFTVIATDAGTPSLWSSATVYITLLDINDEAPVFRHDGYSFSVAENQPSDSTVGQVAAVDRDSPPFSKLHYSIESNADFEIDSSTGVIETTRSLDREVTPMFHLLIVARDAASPYHSSSASVTVHVADLNDNDPVFEFPNVFNNTVQVPNNAPSHYAVSRIRARDLDFGLNAQIQYFITDGNEDGYFQLDIKHGVLKTAKDIVNLKIRSLKLEILIRDQGGLPRSQTATLTIHIVEPMLLNANSEHAGLLSGDNFTIVVSLAVVSAAITIILVVLIILIYKRSQARKNYGTYNCRKEALRIWQHSVTRVSDERTLTSDMYNGLNGSSMLTGSVMNCTAGKKEVSFNMDVEMERRPNSQQSMRSTIDSHTLQNPQAQSSALTTGNSVSTFGSVTLTNHPLSRQVNLQAEQRQLEVERLMDMLRRGEYETNSVISEEDSTTDSGRGPSEEGDHGHLNTDCTIDRKKTRHYSKHSPDAQVVPSISNQSTPTSNQKQLSLLPSHIVNHSPNHLSHPTSPRDSLGSPNSTLNRDLEKISRELTKFEAHDSRLNSDSTDSVRSDSELLHDTSTNPQLECAFIQSATPATPVAVWRNSDYSPTSFYASYLDYRNPAKSSQLQIVSDSIDIENSPKPAFESLRKDDRNYNYVASPQNTSWQKQSFCAQRPKKPLAENPGPTLYLESKDGELSHFNDTEYTETGIMYDTADMSEALACQTYDNTACQMRHDSCASQTSDRTVYPSPSKTPDNAVCEVNDRRATVSSNTPGTQSQLEVVKNDHNSSTSGSCVVDPQDLCDEIDKIFFTESEA